MSLFVGNIAKSVNHDDLEEAFKKFGPCKYRIKNNYAFVDFDNENEAEDAKDALHEKDFDGQPLNIEWSKRSAKYDESKSTRPASKKSTEGCHRCGKLGHFARECKSARKRSRSRSPYDSRRDRGRRDDRGYRYRSRSPRDRRSRSPRDRDYRRRDDRDRRDRFVRDRSPLRRRDDSRENHRRDNRRRDSSPRDKPERRERSRTPPQQHQERPPVDHHVPTDERHD